MTLYILDTNVIADLFRPDTTMQQRIKEARAGGNIFCIAQPVYYETLRGLLRKKAERKLSIFKRQLIPLFEWTPVIDADWELAAQYWAEAISKGKQLSDMDLLIAAIASRLDATIVSADEDFDALPVRRENWRGLTTNDSD
ncbi:MAG: PIN domain-containing protein [Anaerolineales bacterium]|nr:PIN domain-containing protein [Anaerolineales bacterium]